MCMDVGVVTSELSNHLCTTGPSAYQTFRRQQLNQLAWISSACNKGASFASVDERALCVTHVHKHRFCARIRVHLHTPETLLEQGLWIA